MQTWNRHIIRSHSDFEQCLTSLEKKGQDRCVKEWRKGKSPRQLAHLLAPHARHVALINLISIEPHRYMLLPTANKIMAPAKRKANTAADSTSTAPTKRQKKIVEPTASSSRPSRTSLAEAAAPRSTRSLISGKSVPGKPAKNATKASVKGTAKKSEGKTATKVKATNGRKRGKSAKTTTDKEETPAPKEKSTVLVDVPFREKPAVTAEAEDEVEVNGEDPAYWLMKAEPESRIEKGKDLKFSIDDLEAASEPEKWDGMYRLNWHGETTADTIFAGVRNAVGKSN